MLYQYQGNIQYCKGYVSFSVYCRDQLPKSQQLVVTFAAGYIAGVFCAIVSHPADSVVSKLNSDKGSTAIQAAKALGMRGEFD